MHKTNSFAKYKENVGMPIHTFHSRQTLGESHEPFPNERGCFLGGRGWKKLRIHPSESDSWFRESLQGLVYRYTKRFYSLSTVPSVCSVCVCVLGGGQRAMCASQKARSISALDWKSGLASGPAVLIKDICLFIVIYFLYYSSTYPHF